MRVLMISPGFPADIPYFTRALSNIGAQVLGIGDQHESGLPPEVSDVLSGYLQTTDLWAEDNTVDEVANWLSSHGVGVDRVECLWEPGVVLAAKLRARLGIGGLSVEQAIAFRDKETMKQVLDAAGIRTPHHYRAETADEVRSAAERIGYPLVVKPIAGAGSADTYTADGPDDLEAILAAVSHVAEVSVEEYIDGEEYTYDTVTANGEVLFESVTWYRPKPLVTRLNPWISQSAICLRDITTPEIAVGVDLGRRVLAALGFTTGFTHMEWFRTPSGEAVFGEIGARAPGGRLPHGMNLSADFDVFTGWAEAVCSGRISQDTTKVYNAALVFKRAQGDGTHISRIEGLEPLLVEYGALMPVLDLAPVGAARSDWRQVVTGDGWMVARHPDLATTLHIADRLASEVRLIADR
ncbi:MAG: ATP-grasp domain-containing protein [Actinomycetia bacterium]|nr:ATP-grasp domain-containing protein [Actinomycetes bacterium]